MTINSDAVALLGTSADPPTVGHQALLEGLLLLFPKVVTWASDNPLKTHWIPLESRHMLLQELVKAIDDPNLELIQDLSSPWAITTLEKASRRWPNRKLVFVVGSDLAEQIPTWVKAKDILQKAKIAIAPRLGWPISSKGIREIKSLGGQIDMLPLEIPAAASSEVRKQPKLSHLPESIKSIVLKENLYGLNGEYS